MEERDKLLAEIAALEERENYYGAQVVGSGDDLEKAAAFAAELSATQAKIAAKKEQLEQLEGASAKAQDELFNQFDNISVGGINITLRELAASEQSYQFLSAWFQQYVGDMAQQHAVVVASYQSENEKLKEEMDDVLGTNENLQEEIKVLDSKVIALNEQLEDIGTKRDAAVKTAEEAQEETKRLAADNESLRKQLESTSKPSQTNLNTDLAVLAKQLNDAKPAIYNKRWEDPNRKTTYLAELATTGETISFGYLEAGKYREVSPEEAETFRTEAPSAPVVVDVATDPVAEEVLNSPSETDAGVQTDSTPGEMVSEAVSRAEFQALKAEVESIKRTLNLEVAA